MSLGYRAVGWNRQKRLYDATLLGGVLAFLVLALVAGRLHDPQATAETLVIRASGGAAFVLLHVVLSIGPLCRLDPRFLPLLYNRRHMGVTTFALALVHGGLSVFQFHALGDANPLVSVFTASARYGSLPWFPFQPLGLGALAILFLLAATSHDFWLANLGAPVWKTLHLGAYLAWALAVGHVALGALQVERGPWAAVPVALGAAWLLGLHLVAGFRERAGDRPLVPRGDGLADVCAADEIPPNRARVVTLGGERVAIFRHAGGLSALSNVCRHQGGPLGEGRVIDGCVTCPWHGYQYRPEDGASPPPFTERVATYRVRVEDGRVLVDPRAHPPGTPLPPARLGAERGEGAGT